jgi:cysteine synthase
MNNTILMRKSINAVINTRKDIVDFLYSGKDMNGLFDLETPIEKHRIDLYKECYYNIGNTPVHIIPLRNNNKLHIKMEYENAMGGNHYSRYWLPYLFIAETLELIQPYEDEILEVTSGSSGIALANACENLGYKLTIIVPESITNARLQALEKPCVNIIKVNGYIDACIEKMLEIRNVDRCRYFVSNHSEEKANIITYVFSRIANEFINENGVPDYSILALGNGTSAEAVCTTFQHYQKDKKCWFIAYHPDFSRRNTKPILGLLPPRVKFRHVENIKEKLDDIEFTNCYNIREIRKHHHYDSEVLKLGHTSLYALAIAEKMGRKTENATFFSIAYDEFRMYD